MNFLLLHGGSDERNGDYSWLRKAADSGLSSNHWGSLKNAAAGDVVFFYVGAPVSAIVATGRILRDARPGKYRRYEAEVGEIRWVERHIELKRLKQEFPDWRWVDYPRAKLALDALKANRLLKLTKLGQIERVPKSLPRGGGFGTSENNARVERAAVRFVTRHLRRKDYKVQSVERDWMGFDLLCSKPFDELHVEVKGNSVANEAFQITPNELKRAKGNPKFRLALVNEALTRLPKLRFFTSRQMFSRFDFTPISFAARKKEQVSVFMTPTASSAGPRS